MAEMVTRDDFEAKVLEPGTPVIVDFFATWCGPCRMVGPVLEDLVAKTDGAVKLYKLDIDQFPDLAQAFQIFSVPTMMRFEGRKVTHRVTGALPEAQLAAQLGL